jgi:hypothetical protein
MTTASSWSPPLMLTVPSKHKQITDPTRINTAQPSRL